MRIFRRRQWDEYTLIAMCLLGMLFGIQRTAIAYIDPGTGQQVWITLGPILGIILASLTVILFPLRWMWRIIVALWERLPHWMKVATVCVLILDFVASATALGMWVTKDNGTPVKILEPRANVSYKRVLVIGMDGLDPKLLGTMMDAGELPNFARLRDEGTFSPLRTTIPPESPVAWTAAATGCNPGQAGVFDFIRRDPKTYLPDLALLQSKKRDLFTSSESSYMPVTNQRAVWDILSEHGIPTTVIRWPVTFPPTSVNGRLLSGLGVPDICGTLGTYRFFTTGEVNSDDDAPDRVTGVMWDGARIVTELPGPEILSFGGTKTSTVSVVIERADTKDTVSIALGKSAPITLKVGEWSGWQSVVFPGGLSKPCPAMVKMYLTSLDPELNLYVSPLNIDPSNPAFPITSPKEFSKELAEEIGLYATLGMPEDNQAVQHGRIPLSAFLDLCDEITNEREKMFDRELKQFKEGALFFVFDTSDRIQHMFWAATDREHPAHTAELEKQYGDVIKAHYRRMDAVIEKALGVAQDGQTAVLVLSDHGFTNFSRAVHLNRWLIENGFMVLKDEEEEGRPLLKSVDWSKTKAYAVGFCSLYINMKGREGQGCVSEEDYPIVRETLAQDLKLWRDSLTGHPIVRNAYFREDIYRGERFDEAPDIVMGYYPGYRASWQTALGAAPAQDTVVDNDELWAGDHLVDAPCVPGIFLSNVTTVPHNPHLTDLAPAVLEALGVSLDSN